MEEILLEENIILVLVLNTAIRITRLYIKNVKKMLIVYKIVSHMVLVLCYVGWTFQNTSTQAITAVTFLVLITT